MCIRDSPRPASHHPHQPGPRTGCGLVRGQEQLPRNGGAAGQPFHTNRLGATLPIGRVVGPTDIAALAVHLMTNNAVTGATFDIDGGQQLVEG